MRNRRLLTVLLVAATCLAGRAQTDADSLGRAVLADDFIQSSLLIIGPSNELYTGYGHAALRMECPSNRLDYCFTFEMPMNPASLWSFFASTAKAGFVSVPTDVFFEQYRREGRSIDQYPLNLCPLQEQLLWCNLDEEAVQAPHWEFDVMQNNCSSMVIYIVRKSLMGEQLVYNDLNPVLAGNYRDVVDYCSVNAPWSALFWDTKIGLKGWDKSHPDTKLMPQLLAETWLKATLTDSAGTVRPLIKGGPQRLNEQTLAVEPPLVTPLMVLALLLIVVVALVAWTIYRKKNNNKTLR